MSLTTFSIFYYDFEIDSDHLYIDFDEGSGELTATVDQGAYTPTELAEKIKLAMDAAGTLVYTVVFNRADETFKISSTASFDLLVQNGSSANKAYEIFGFTGADRTGASSYTGARAGDFYAPQFILQDHVSSDNFQRMIKPTVNVTSTGAVEVVRFGTERFIQANIKYANNIMEANDGRVIKHNPEGVEDLQRFMQFIITKKKFEYMPDYSSRNTFQTVILESTEQEKEGTGFTLKELYDKGLPNFFETGKLVFRVIE